MDHLGRHAASTRSEAEAGACAGALPMLAAALVPSAAPSILAAAPTMITGMSNAARVLREHQDTRDLVQSLPRVARRTALRVGQWAGSGHPVTPNDCARILADTTVRVLGEEAGANPESSSEAPYDGLDLRALRALARKDRDAALSLWGRYQNMSDVELRRRSSRKDGTARAVLDRRTPSNEAALKRALGTDYRPPHSASVTRYRTGAAPWRRQLRSGNATPEEAIRFPGWRERMLATHTEARAVRMANLKHGDHLSIIGQYNPCWYCRQAMQEAARRSGATIRYSWMGGTATFPR